MTDDARCDETRELAAELALGVADGEARARVLEHTASCADCRRELERFSAIADDLLVLAPEHEPPLGFELSVLRAIQPPRPTRRRGLRWLVAVAAVLVAVSVTAGAMLVGFRDERRLAEHYRATLAQANGSYFGAVRLHDAAGAPAGVVFAYRGSPSWITVTVVPGERASVERAEVVDRRGRRIPLASFVLADGVWGGALPIDLGDVAAVHLVDGDGRSILIADL
jgi:anti-sigma factor RsiW